MSSGMQKCSVVDRYRLRDCLKVEEAKSFIYQLMHNRIVLKEY